MVLRKPTGTAHYITAPAVAPILPATVELQTGEVLSMRKALPIARAVLMQAQLAIKKQIPAAKRTQYSLERSLFHLKRVKIQGG